MNEKISFGEASAKDFSIGDIVEWTTWDSDADAWKRNYGILISIQNEIRSNRLVSISRVVPLHARSTELEFFTMSLRMVSHNEQIDIDI
tara:strand:- start:159 stop:425 length:267 start_codon:yes stop_codon:yes gene_type:complete